MTSPSQLQSARRSARVQTVLLEAEGPLILLLRDSVDCSWLGSATGTSADDGDEFVCVPISPGRLAQFRHGEIDLRTVLTAPEVSTPARVLIPSGVLSGAVELVATEISPDWLPDEGFLLTTFIEPVASEYKAMAVQATSQNRPIVHLNLNPPEARERPKIDADRLGMFLTLFQNGIHWANSVASRPLSIEQRRARIGPENYTFEVFAFALNSFEVHMQAKMSGDLFGHSPHVEALRKLDEITSKIDDIDAAIEVAKANRGRFVTAIKSLMEFIGSSKTPVSYSWTIPQSSVVTTQTIRPEPAQALYEALIQREELTRQEVTLTGVFTKLDKKAGRWRIETSEGEYSGTVADDVPVTLHNVGPIGTKYYKFQCREFEEEATSTGKQTARYEMITQPEEISH